MQKMRPFQKFYFIIFMQTEHPGKKTAIRKAYAVRMAVVRGGYRATVILISDIHRKRALPT